MSTADKGSGPSAVSPLRVIAGRLRPLGYASLLFALAGTVLIADLARARAPVATGFPLRSSHISPVTGAITISADIVGDRRPLGVQFKLDGYVLDAMVAAPPFQLVWSAASATNGDHVITAEARYASGLVVESVPLRLTVANPATLNRLLYVNAATGNDANDGLSPATSWRTLDRANRSVRPGDTVRLRGTFAGQYIRPGVSGTAARPITYRSEPGHVAVLDTGKWDTTVWLPGLSYIVVDGIHIRNGSYTAIALQPGAHHVVVRNCTLTNDSAIFIRQASDNVIESNTITDVGTEAANAGDAIWIANGASRNKILRNTLSRAGHMLITVGGDQPDDAEAVDNVIAHNALSNPLAGNVALQWRARRTLVEFNRLADAGTSPTSVAGTRNGIQTYAKDNVIRYNEIVNNAAEGIFLSGFTYASVVHQDAIGNQIYNNVVYGNGRWGLFINEKHGRTVRDNLIANNIFFRNRGVTLDGRTYTVGIEHYHTSTAWPVGDLNGNQIRNNIFLRRPGSAEEAVVLRVRRANQGGNLSYTLAQFETTHSGASGNLGANPHFTDEATGDFTLRPESPAVDRGVAIPGVVHQGPAPDVGAHEVGGLRPRLGRF